MTHKAADIVLCKLGMELQTWKPQVPAKKARRRQRVVKPEKKHHKVFSPLLPSKSPPSSFMDLKVHAPHNTTFNLYPRGTFVPFVEGAFLFMSGITLKEQISYINTIILSPCHYFYKNILEKKRITKQFKAACFMIRGIRGIFRRFLHVWRVSRIRPANTEDFVTLEVPKNPIHIVNWHSRNMFVFEASSLMRDITERLLHNDGFFEVPQLPRNPFTNLPFTQSEIISVWNQLASSKITISSVFTNYRQTRWNLDAFASEYSLNLQLNALRKTMANRSHYDYRERMLDFIQFSHDHHHDDCDIVLFRKVLLEKPDHYLIKLWAKECTSFYETSLIHSKSNHRLIKIQQKILLNVENLITRSRIFEDIFPA